MNRRVAVVTGANQGLGKALVTGLADRLEDDAEVYLTGRNERRVNEAATDLHQRGFNVAPYLLDVTDSENVEEFASMIHGRHGAIDIFISNAAARIHPDETPAAQVRRFVVTNNHATTSLLRVLLPLLRPGGRSSSLQARSELCEAFRSIFTRVSMTPT